MQLGNGSTIFMKSGMQGFSGINRYSSNSFIENLSKKKYRAERGHPGTVYKTRTLVLS